MSSWSLSSWQSLQPSLLQVALLVVPEAILLQAVLLVVPEAILPQVVLLVVPEAILL
jgi:hypothetical protein